MDTPVWLRKILSFFRFEIVEEAHSPHNKRLWVEYERGKMVLNSETVTLSFGNLTKVYKAAFQAHKNQLKKVQTVLLLGLGAGTVPTLLQQYGTYAITGVEIDPEIIRLANTHFHLPKIKGLKVIVADAKSYVFSCEETFDCVIVDLFEDDKVPVWATDTGFLLRLKDLLADGGMLMYNRLQHTPELAAQTQEFTRKMQEILPGTRYIKAFTNRMLIYEKTQ